MHILHIFDHSIPLHSGYTFRSRSIIRQQRDIGWDTHHITGPKHNLVTVPSGDEEDIDELKFFRTPLTGHSFSKLPVLNQWYIIKALESRLKEIIPLINPTILHAHSPALNGLAALKVGKKFGIPVVYEVRAFWEDAAVDHGTSKEWGIRYRITRALETYVVKKADAVTTICEGLRNDLIERGVSENKITVIPNAVDISSFSFDSRPDVDLQNQYGLGNSQTIGFIGSFYAYEGLDFLLKAMPKIIREHPNLKLLLVGGGPQEQVLKDITEELKLTENVIFTGRVPHDQIQRYYSLINIFIYPRIKIRLTELVTPLKPLEAMAMGGVVIASDIGGHRELIENNKNGVLFQAEDINSLASTVTSIVNNNEQRKNIGEAARKYVELNRSWPVSVSRYKNVYAQVL